MYLKPPPRMLLLDAARQARALGGCLVAIRGQAFIRCPRYRRPALRVVR